MTFEEMLRNREEKGRAAGMVEGFSEALMTLLAERGELPESLREQIVAETDAEILKNWLLLASKTTSIEAFLENM